MDCLHLDTAEWGLILLVGHITSLARMFDHGPTSTCANGPAAAIEGGREEGDVGACPAFLYPMENVKLCLPKADVNDSGGSEN